MGLGRERAVEGDEVRLGQDLLQRHPAGAARVEDPRLEPLDPPRDGLPDAPVSDDSDRGPVQVPTEQQPGLPGQPVAPAHRELALHQAASDPEHQRDREVRGRLGQHVGRVAHRNSPRRRGGDVHVVHPDGVVRDGAQARRRLEQVGVHDVGQQREQALGPGRLVA
jgi:hypothetical protein